MTKDNYINLFNYCSRHLINKENTENIHMFNKITKNLEKKIKNSLIDNKNFIILYDGEYNKTINNILSKLIKHVYPFRITYRKKTYKEMSVIDILLDSTPYILIIDWINYHKISLELKLYTLMKKYINYRTDNKSFDLIYDSNLLTINHGNDT